mmetsp:Transcript_8835/g.16241  ORF Transcript_8835/g.16241 Transcript_8835/m.16241 type:complete len:184 (+) Transcript_8835:149-700(+)
MVSENGEELVEAVFKVQPQVVKDEKRPSVIYQQITFKDPIQLAFICFRNYYCGYITIKRQTSSSDGKKVWQTILHRHQLMKDPHFEDDAQARHTICMKQMNSKYVSGERIKDLRFYLYQPSPSWRSFGLRQLTCYTKISTKKSDKNLHSQSTLVRTKNCTTYVYYHIQPFVIYNKTSFCDLRL